MLHVRNFDVADCSTRRQLLEFGLELQLVECIDFLGNMYVITVGNVVLVGNMRNDTESLL